MRQENRRSLYKKMVVQKSGSATLVHSRRDREYFKKITDEF